MVLSQITGADVCEVQDGSLWGEFTAYHPRATEMLALISGGPLQVGFVDTHGNAFIDILNPGDITIFPRGMMHFEANVGKEEANFISALNSQNPGVMPSSVSIMKLPSIAVAAAFNISQRDVNKLESRIYCSGIGLKLMPGCGV
ncbi:germin-like protein 2-4 [Cryptomeria japonica]|uniref:germin-like protein 2-4 n=1 Tax=Cryptomeria japonica TaxID=3369 RepID=UPI0027DA2ED5|nr:germin-like protein 2-4 [Cryptomeria japonica]